MRAGTWLAVDQLGLGSRQRVKRAGQVSGREADVMQALASPRQVATDAALAVDRLYELEMGSGGRARRQEAETDRLGGEKKRRLVRLESEESPIAGQGLVDRGDDDRYMVDGTDGGRHRLQPQRGVTAGARPTPRGGRG